MIVCLVECIMCYRNCCYCGLLKTLYISRNGEGLIYIVNSRGERVLRGIGI